MSEAVVRIYESEILSIVHETGQFRDVETGGSLLGLWTTGGNPTIMLASRPGRRAVRGFTHFEQDLKLHRLMEDTLVERHGVQSVGLWHSHHNLGLSELSGGDMRRTVRFARRARRPLFCDLLCYFTDERAHRSVSPEVTIKPYVYADAANGTRRPTALVVLPGVSPLRLAAANWGVSGHVAEELQVALARPPESWQGRWRTVRSIELAERDDEDLPAETRAGIWWERRRGRRGAHEEPQAPDLTEETGRDGGYEIPDLQVYIQDHLEPELRELPDNVTCELEPILEGRAARLTLVAPDRSEEYELYLGWDGKQPVVTRHVVRRAQSAAPEDLGLGHVRTLRAALQLNRREIGKFGGRL